MLNHISSYKVSEALGENIICLLPDIGFSNGTAKSGVISFRCRGFLRVVIEGDFSGRWSDTEQEISGDALDLVMWAMDLSHLAAKHWSYEWLIGQGVPRELLFNDESCSR